MMGKPVEHIYIEVPDMASQMMDITERYQKTRLDSEMMENEKRKQKRRQ